MLGQVFTPPAIARWMADWACAERPERILEPAVGPGVFVGAIEAIAARNGNWQPNVFAYEIDPSLRRAFKATPRSISVTTFDRDFIRCSDRRRYDACVANPPYVRHHNLSYDDTVYASFDTQIGARLGRMTNLYGLFLLRIAGRLAPRGRAAVITPAEWLNADFGVPLKRHLLRENLLDGLVVFEDDSLVFDGVLTTAAIVLLRRGRAASEAIRIASVRDANALLDLKIEAMRSIPMHDLDPARKWRGILSGEANRLSSKNRGRSLGDIATCLRGIATGANDYFTLTDSERRDAGIDRRDVSPCITRATHSACDEFDQAIFDRNRNADRKVWLLDPREELTAAIKRYLKQGRLRRIHKRYLPAHRPVWFRPEQRAPAPIWVPVFARGGFRFIRNRARVRNLTAFHGINPRRDDTDSVDTLLAYLRSDAAQDAVEAQMRIYGGGLRKLEPRDVLKIPIPDSLF